MRKKSTARVLGAATLALLVTAMFVVVAVPVLAHHPEISAEGYCDDDGLIYFDYETWAWVSTSYYPNPTDDQRTNNDVGIYLDGVLVESGAFNVGNGFTFSGGPILVTSGASVATVRAVAEVKWGVGEDLGSAGEYRETAVTLPTECESPTTTTTTTPPPPPPPPPPVTGSIGDLVWEDTNADGHQGDFEFGVSGVTVNLLDGSGVTLKTTVTNASGNYLFTGLAAGTYQVQFLFPAGFQVSPLNAAGATLDSDAGANGFTASIVLGSGATDLSWDAGIFRIPEVLPQVITTTTAVAPPETLPFTGSSNSGAAGLGVALLALGGLMVLVARHREDDSVITTGS